MAMLNNQMVIYIKLINSYRIVDSTSLPKPRRKVVAFLDACDAALNPVYFFFEAGLASWQRPGADLVVIFSRIQ
jgi:hypothetical protein